MVQSQPIFDDFNKLVLAHRLCVICPSPGQFEEVEMLGSDLLDAGAGLLAESPDLRSKHSDKDTGIDEQFGTSISSIGAVLAVVFGLAVAFLLFIRVRNPILVRMAFRNVLRRPGQSMLILGGLMLATAIIASAFTVGDSVTHSIKNSASTSLRAVDELLVVDEDSEVWQGRALPDGFQESVFQELGPALEADPDLAFVERTDGVPSVGTFHTIYQAGSRLATDSSGEYADTTLTAVGDDFFESNQYRIALTVPDYTLEDEADSAAVWEAVRTNPGLAIVNATIVPSLSNAAFALSSDQFTLDGVEDLYVENDSMDPVRITVRDLESGSTLDLEVVSVCPGWLPLGRSLLGSMSPRRQLAARWTRRSTSSTLALAKPARPKP